MALANHGEIFLPQVIYEGYSSKHLENIKNQIFTPTLALPEGVKKFL